MNKYSALVGNYTNPPQHFILDNLRFSPSVKTKHT